MGQTKERPPIKYVHGPIETEISGPRNAYQGLFQVGHWALPPPKELAFNKGLPSLDFWHWVFAPS